jgi:hypothetical protein
MSSRADELAEIQKFIDASARLISCSCMTAADRPSGWLAGNILLPLADHVGLPGGDGGITIEMRAAPQPRIGDQKRISYRRGMGLN